VSDIEAFGTTFQNPILLAAGTAGFGREVAGAIALDELGGLITKAVSPEPRAGHPPPRVTEFGGGMLNAVGLANPGLERVTGVELPWLAAHLRRARVIANVVGNVVQDFVTVVRALDEFAVVAAVELNLSCPNTARGGEEFLQDRGGLTDLIRKCRAVTSKPIIAKLAPTLADMVGTAEAAAGAGADGFSLVNTIPGTLFRLDGSAGRTARPRLGFGRGGVSGPPLLPVGVLAVQRVKAATGMPIIGVGGVRTPSDIDQYLAAGASLVAVGTAALADPRVPEGLARAWRRRG
jgi:dihydroorotate dehydrogenase (NAD+) catalytic subunit